MTKQNEPAESLADLLARQRAEFLSVETGDLASLERAADLLARQQELDKFVFDAIEARKQAQADLATLQGALQELVERVESGAKSAEDLAEANKYTEFGREQRTVAGYLGRIAKDLAKLLPRPAAPKDV
jgi:hypothetical protein